MSLKTTPEVEFCQCKPLLQSWLLGSCCEVIQKLPLLPCCSLCLWRVTSPVEPHRLRPAPCYWCPSSSPWTASTLMLLNELSFQEAPKNIQRKNNLVMAQKVHKLTEGSLSSSLTSKACKKQQCSWVWVNDNKLANNIRCKRFSCQIHI